MNLQTQISPIVSRKSKRIGKSFPKRASTGSPKTSLLFNKTKSTEGNSNRTPFTSKYKLFSSGTQSKHQPKFCLLRSKSQTSFHPLSTPWAGSKNGTTRKGPEAVFSIPQKNVSRSIILGCPAICVSTKNQLS